MGEDVEIPWWSYGARGMQLWFPKTLAEPVSSSAGALESHYVTDPELEFDKEVYPIGISLAEVSIIGALRSVTYTRDFFRRDCFRRDARMDAHLVVIFFGATSILHSSRLVPDNLQG